MQMRIPTLRSFVASAIAVFALAGSTHAQLSGACCSDEGTCTVTSAYACALAGGTFKGLGVMCGIVPECDPLAPGVGMSRTAARRLAREGVVHTLWVSNSQALYESNDTNVVAMWDLLAEGVIIAPQIAVDLRHHGIPNADPEVSAETAAAAVLAAAAAAQAAWLNAWDVRGRPPPGPFYWALRPDALGVGFDWYLGTSAKLPAFSNHDCDVAEDKLPGRRSIPSYHAGTVGTVINSRRFQIPDPNEPPYPSSSQWDFFGQFTEDFYLNPWPATMTVGGAEVEITAFDPVFRTFTLAETYTGTLTADAPFTITRTEMDFPGIHPCYFFKNGSNELEIWVEAFCNYMADEENWPEGLPEPVAVIVGAEDFPLDGVDYANYLDYLADERAATDPLGTGLDEGYTIDGVRNLATWHADFAIDRNGAPLAIPPAAGGYSPLNEDVRSYLYCTLQTAYNYHREQSTWRHFRELWPRAILTQYLLGDSYGVMLEAGEEPEVAEVPTGPAEERYHGTSEWKGSVSWDAYYCITNPQFLPWIPVAENERIVPMGYNSAWHAPGVAGAGSPMALDQIPVQWFEQSAADPAGSPAFSPSPFLIEGLPLYVEFLGAGPNVGTVYTVETYAAGVLTVTPDLEEETGANDAFVVYHRSDTYADYHLNVLHPKWPMMETFCDRYGEPINAAGFLATSKKWAAETARAQTRALPENPYTVYYCAGNPPFGSYDEQPEKVSMYATYPHAPFTSKDGYLDGTDWGEVGSQAMDYGVNHFVWFQPDLVDGSGNAALPLLTHLTTAIDAMQGHYDNNYIQYASIGCIADWNKSGTITTEDATAFHAALTGEPPDLAADLNNDGLFNEDDETIFEAAFCVGDCAPIASGGCTGSGTCESADWCGDESVGVEDIFCFLSDWFAQAPPAYNFGGTPGVSAIFAFLSNWFAYGIGPCDD